MESTSAEESNSIISETESESRSLTDSESASKTSASISGTNTSDTIPMALRAHAANNTLTAMRKKRTLSQWSPLRVYIMEVVESTKFTNFILFVILLNTLLIAIQTDKSSSMRSGWYLAFVDNVFLGIYLSELFMKMFVHRQNFFSKGWNNFDLFIIMTSFIDWLKFIIASTGTMNPKIFRLLRVFRAIRALRALRTLRTVSFLQSLQTIVSTILKSIPALGSIVMLLSLIMFIFAIIGRELYGDIDPERFGQMWISIFMLFTVLSLDDWFKLYNAIQAKDKTIIIFLIAFIVIETFVLLNFFVAVIVNNLQANQMHMKKKMKKLKAKEEQEEQKKEGDRSSKLKKMIRDESTGPKSVDDYYPDDHIPHRQKQNMGQYLMLLSALENNSDTYQSQQRMLDELVHLVAPKEDEELTLI